MTRARLLLQALLLASAGAAHAQDDGHERLILPGGGFALSAQGPIGFETSLHCFMGIPAGKENDHLYIVGPELTIGTYFGDPGFWGQRLGIRQFYLYESFFGVSGTIGVENYTPDFSLDDTRWYIQGGPTFAGVLSLEYGRSFRYTGNKARVDDDRIVVRLELNLVALTKIFEKVPFS